MSLNIEAVTDHLEPLPHDVYNFTRVDLEILKATGKALMIWYEGAERWIPLSVLRCDNLRNIWLANWFINKEKMFL
jgi:hypothetical protein